LSFLTFLGEMIVFHGKNNWTLRNWILTRQGRG
jgi:hypothetical protein